MLHEHRLGEARAKVELKPRVWPTSCSMPSNSTQERIRLPIQRDGAVERPRSSPLRWRMPSAALRRSSPNSGLLTSRLRTSQLEALARGARSASRSVTGLGHLMNIKDVGRSDSVETLMSDPSAAQDPQHNGHYVGDHVLVLRSADGLDCTILALSVTMCAGSLPSWLLGEHSKCLQTRFRSWFAWCQGHALAPLAASHGHIDAWARQLGEMDGCSPATVARRLSTLTGFLNYAVDEGVIARNPATSVRRPKVGSDSTSTGLDRDELAQTDSRCGQRLAA